jgi:hypothetical protein
MGKPNTILDFFKRKNAQSSNANVGDASSPASDFDISSLDFDPGLRCQICKYFGMM